MLRGTDGRVYTLHAALKEVLFPVNGSSALKPTQQPPMQLVNKKGKLLQLPPYRKDIDD